MGNPAEYIPAFMDGEIDEEWDDHIEVTSAHVSLRNHSDKHANEKKALEYTIWVKTSKKTVEKAIGADATEGAALPSPRADQASENGSAVEKSEIGTDDGDDRSSTGQAGAADR